MRFMQLNLLAVGPFTNQPLDLSTGNPGLHVVLGNNEAGKSSALRALRALLFGFDQQAPENFVHEHSQLRVGSTLRHSDGTVLNFVRRKGKKGTLLGSDEKQIADDSLARFLGAVDADQFSTFFGIGHDDLRRGGDEILKGGGKVGESLFAAGPGGARLHKLAVEITRRAEELYKPSGRAQLIPTTLAEYRKQIDQMKTSSLSVEEWTKHQSALAVATGERAEIAKLIATETTSRIRLERLGKAIPLLARRTDQMARLQAMPKPSPLSDDFASQRQLASHSLLNSDDESKNLGAQIERIDQQLGGLTVSHDLLGRTETIEALHAELSRYRDAVQKVPVHRLQRDRSQQEAHRILSDVRPDLPIDQAVALRLSTAQRAQIELLAREWEGLKNSMQLSSVAADEAEQEKQQCEMQAAALPAERDVRLLQAALTSIREHGNLEQQRATLHAELEKETRQAENKLKNLAPWKGSLTDLELLAVPSAESIEHARRQHDTADLAREKIDAEIRKLKKEIAVIELQMAEARAGGEIPSDVDLHAARNRREAGWRLVRRAWLDGVSADAEVEQFTAGKPLDAVYEQSVAGADAVSDTLRRESDRVVAQATRTVRQRAMALELEQQQHQLASANQGCVEVAAAWKALWMPIGVDPLSPAEMASWAVRQRELAGQAESIREKSAKLESLDRTISSCRQLLENQLRPLNEVSAADAPLLMLVACGQAVVDQVQADQANRTTVISTAKRLEKQLKDRQDKLAGVLLQQAGWKTKWLQAISQLGAPSDCEPAVASAMLKQIDDLLAKLSESENADGQLILMGNQIESFERQAKELASVIAPDLAGHPVDQVMSALDSRLKQARDHATKRIGLTDQRTQLQQSLESAAQRAVVARRKLAELCQIAGCESADQLPEAERKHAEWKQADAELKQTELNLLQHSSGETIDELANQVAGLNADAMPAQLLECTEKLDTFEHRRSELDQTIGAEKRYFNEKTESATAAETFERAQSLLADVRESAGEYARLQLARNILALGIERYRQRKQGPLLTAASTLFATLTRGSFKALRADFDDNDDPVLHGVRADDGRPVGVQAMSDGTRDQLYLALRLAALQDYLSQSEPIPFIVDDILVHFDNDRSLATLKVLAELSRQTQVILFTHHAHIAELAKQCGEDVHVRKLSR